VGPESAIRHPAVPDGLAQAFVIGRDFIGNGDSALVLGDNIFYGHEFATISLRLDAAAKRAQRYSPTMCMIPNVTAWSNSIAQGRAISLEEKPLAPKSNYAVTGLYFYDNQVLDFARDLKPSPRGELEITDVNRLYLERDQLNVQVMGRGHAWLDTGTHESLLDASQFIATIEKRQGLKVACPEEIAYRKGWVDAAQLEKLAQPMLKNPYGQYLLGCSRKGFSDESDRQRQFPMCWSLSRGCSATSAGFSSKASISRHSMRRSGRPSISFRITIRNRARAYCAACITNWRRKPRASWCAWCRAVFDVAVDIRKGSKTYGQWVGEILSAENKKQMWIPAGLAHGFLTLSDTAEFLYKTTDYYSPEHERCIRWDDADLGIQWPLLRQ
jgi:glucose-1-phosphate thymidylyltransferase short form